MLRWSPASGGGGVLAAAAAVTEQTAMGPEQIVSYLQWLYAPGVSIFCVLLSSICIKRSLGLSLSHE